MEAVDASGVRSECDEMVGESHACVLQVKEVVYIDIRSYGGLQLTLIRPESPSGATRSCAPFSDKRNL